MADLGQNDLENLIHDRLVDLDDDEGTCGWGGVWTDGGGNLMVEFHGTKYRIILRKEED